MSAETDRWARGQLLQAIAVVDPTLASGRIPFGFLQILQAITRGEGYYGRATRPAGWEKTHNWGAIHGGYPPCKGNDLLTVDTDAAGKEYPVCIKAYPTEFDGCVAFVKRVKDAFPAFMTGDASAAAHAMKSVYRYDATETKYTDMIEKNAKVIAAALNEPYSVTRSNTTFPFPVPGKSPPAAPPSSSDSSGAGLGAVLLLGGLTVILARSRRRT